MLLTQSRVSNQSERTTTGPVPYYHHGLALIYALYLINPNKSQESGTLPQDCKTAKVASLFQKGTKAGPVQYWRNYDENEDLTVKRKGREFGQ